MDKNSKNKNSQFQQINEEAHKDKQKRGDNKGKTQAQRARERAQRRRKIRVKMALYATIAFLGGGAIGTVGGTILQKRLNPSPEGVEYDKDSGEVEINLDELQGKLEVTGTGNKAQEFREKQAQIAITDISKEKAQEEIEEANNPLEVLNILKEAVAKYWEASYGEDVNNVTIRKIAQHVNIYEDTAQNGDKIQRFETNGKYDSDNTIIIVNIETDEGQKYTENLLAEDDRYTRVYGLNEKVEKPESSKLEECARFIFEGQQYYDAMVKNNKVNVFGEKEVSDIELGIYRMEFNKELAKGYDTISQIELFGNSQEKSKEIVDNERE